MKTHLLIIALITMALSACSSVQITPKEGQRIIYDHGTPVVVCLTSKGEKSGVAIRARGSYDGSRVAFLIAYRNKTKSACDFSLENVSATNDKGQKLRLYTASDLTKEAQTRAAIAAACVALGSGAQSFAAAQPSYTTASGGYNGYNTSGTYYGSATTYNPAQQVVANNAIQANMNSQMSSIADGLNQCMGSASEVLSRTTVPPNCVLTGLLVMKKSAVTNFKIQANGVVGEATFLVK